MYSTSQWAPVTVCALASDDDDDDDDDSTMNCRGSKAGINVMCLKSAHLQIMSDQLFQV